MDVSVVIPLYNGASWIEDTIDSVLAQTHTPREIVVVDDGSDDDSPALVQSAFPEVTVVERPGNGSNGAGPARRFGMQHTSAPLVAFLDQDDLWHPSHLRILAGVLRDHDAPAAMAEPETFGEGETPSYDVETRDLRPFSPWDQFPLNSIHSPSCVVVRRRALEHIGGWPSTLKISDINAWFKLTAATPMLETDAVSVGKRVHEASLLQTLRKEKTRSFFREYLEACEDALAYRATVTSEEQERYQDRLEALKAIGNGLEKAVEGDDRFLRKAAHFLDREAHLDREMVKGLWFFGLRLYSSPSSQPPTHGVPSRKTLLGHVIRSWPNGHGEAQQTLARALTQTMSYTAFLSCLARMPFAAVTSLLFLECMKLQLGKAADQAVETAAILAESTRRVLGQWMRLGEAAID